MLIKYKYNNQYGLINLEDISRIHTILFNGTYQLVCTVPSSNSETGYEEQFLGVQGLSACQAAITNIYNIYKQYMITDANQLFIPPKVFELTNNVNYIVASSVTGTPIWSTAQVLADNRAYIQYDLYANGKLLVENVDYTATYPLYRGDNATHTVVFHLTQSGQTYKRSYKCTFKKVEASTES